MADNSEVSLSWKGLDELRQQLQGLPAKLRVRVLRNALAAGAREVRNAAQARAPVLKKPDPRRTAGTLRNAIKVRTSKEAKRDGNVGVFVNVKPLKRAQIAKFKAASGRKAADNPNDPFYWRWVNWGRQGRAAVAAREKASVMRGGKRRVVRSRRALPAVTPMGGAFFLEAGARALPAALKAIERALGPALQRILDRKADS